MELYLIKAKYIIQGICKSRDAKVWENAAYCFFINKGHITLKNHNYVYCL